MFYKCKRDKKNQKNLTFGHLSFSALIKFIICGLFLISFVSAELPKVERTLSILKPDAVEQNLIGNILSRFEKGGLKIVAAKMVRLSKQEAQAFYEVHKDKPFYSELVDFMSSGPILVSVLEGEGAIAKNREIMGVTDPQKALSGTIRKDFAQSIGRNAVHGSDSIETAKKEIDFFFKNDEICER